MGGRGSSSSANGVSSSLKNFSKATEQFNPASVQQPTIQDVLKGNITPKGGVAYSDFKKMSDDEKADVIVMAQMVKPPIFLDDSGMQRFAYFTGMNDKPQIVSDSQLDKMSGTSLYRTVNNSYNSITDIGYTAKDIHKQIAKGDYTMYSDSGGSAHGKAIYFADSVGFFTRAIEVGGPTGTDNIICEASNCIYYKNSQCNADIVNINSHFSSCETFKCR